MSAFTSLQASSRSVALRSTRHALTLLKSSNSALRTSGSRHLSSMNRDRCFRMRSSIRVAISRYLGRCRARRREEGGELREISVYLWLVVGGWRW